MRKIIISILALAATSGSFACTNFIVTKGASSDGSVMVSYTADSHVLYGELYKYNAPSKPYADTATLAVREWDTGRYLGRIKQVPTTYSTVGNMNVHQVCVAESTFGGRAELEDSTGGIDYGSLIYISLQRSKTAREAIDNIVALANEYGYASSGESLSITDKNEAWILEIIGKGCKIVDGKNVNKGIVWVARRIPDGYVSGHANQARIDKFPLNDPENTIYSADVISFARSMGYFTGKDADFSFCDAYAPADFGALRACEARVWSFFRAVAPDMDKYLDYAMGHNAANKMPLWVKPSEKVSPKKLFDCMRDHYEGTPMDMRKDVGAGGNGSPYRWRPMEFEVDGAKYVNERATATQQTGFWFIAQSRSWLPDNIGGIVWFGVDDTGTSALTPIYCSVTDTPLCFKEGNGSLIEYSPTSAFWIVNRVAQFAYLRYDVIEPAVRKVTDKWENDRLAEIATIDKQALASKNPSKVLTDYSVAKAQELFDKWVDLDRYLMVKFIDGNVKKEDEKGFLNNGYLPHAPASPQQPGYNERWKRAVVKDNGEVLKVVEPKK